MAVRCCNCEEWDNGWPQIESAQIMAWNHGASYTGPVFNFCPWCGVELRRVAEDENPDKN